MKLITLESLQHFKSKLDGLFVAKEKKTNSDSEYKVLSDNNLTDEMVLKINSASTITKVSAFENDAKYQTESEVSAATSAAKEAAVESAKSYINEEVTKTNQALASVKSELETSISTKVSAAYKAKGSVAFASLPAPGKAEEGNVYNVTNAFTTTGDFSEGAGKKYPVGTNIVCVEDSDGVYKWDALGGFIDVDAFVRASDIQTIENADIDAMFAG